MGGPGVEWVPCYESAIDSDARTVLALLEGRGIPCRLEPMGARYSVFRYSMTARRSASVRWSPNGWPAFDWLQYVVS